MKAVRFMPILLLSVLAAAQQPCPSGYHHEADSAACWPDVSRQESHPGVQPTAQPTSIPAGPSQQIQMQPTQPVKSASLVIFREKSHWLKDSDTPHIYIDGVEITRMKGGNYFIAPVEPGKHNLSSSELVRENDDRIEKPKFSTPIEVTPGETKFVQIAFTKSRNPYSVAYSCHFIPTTTDDGKTAVSKLHAVD